MPHLFASSLPSDASFNRWPQSRTERSFLDSLNATSLEKAFFERVRTALQEASPGGWQEFVQCLNLYNSGVVQQGELLTLAGELFAGDEELYVRGNLVMMVACWVEEDKRGRGERLVGGGRMLPRGQGEEKSPSTRPLTHSCVLP